MDENKKRDIALMRYSAIAPLISGTGDDYPSLSAYFRDASAKGVTASDGSIRHYSPQTIEKWYRLYKRSGFDALIPSGRSDCGVSRKIDDDLRERIMYMKKTYPRLPAAAIYRQLRDTGVIKPDQLSESTVCRFIKQMMQQEKMTNNQDMRRYERPHINEVWCGDSSTGLFLKTGGKSQRLYVIALIDDASRFITGIDIFFNDNFVNLMSVMKSAISKYGKPAVWNFDNGAAYKNKQMELLAARIGSVINYCKPYTPTQKAKIERWFRTMKDNWMAALDMRDFKTLEDVRESLLTYVRQYNQSPHSALGGKTPQDRFFSESERIKRLSQEQIDRSFMLEIQRRVSADSVIVINNVEYELDYRFAKRRVTLRYTPSMEEIYVVDDDSSLVPVRLLNKHENSITKREKVHLTGGDR